MNGTFRTAGLALALVLARVPLAAADVVTNWNAIMVTTVSGQNPFAQARVAAIMHLAVFEAVNGITGSYHPYLDPPLTAAPGASADAAAVAAAHGVLVNYFPASRAALDTERAASLALIADGQAKTAGIAAGEAAAAALIALRATDGSAPPAFHLPTGVDPGEWQLTPGCPPAGGVLAHWGQVTPFGITRAKNFRSAPPPPLWSRRYARDFNEVKDAGALHSTGRPPHQSDVARFYAAVLAVGTWNPVVSQVTLTRQHTLAFNARLFALLNMAMSDALVAVMETKYVYRFWRPETAIREAALDGNPRTEADPAWEPFIVAPCFPSYGSAHAAASYAARRVAEALLGDHPIAVTLSSPAVAGVVLEYGAFDEITDDIDNARIYGGIHFRFDQRAGGKQGTRIGAWIARHQLRARRGW
jgi:hypothetical protein